MNIILTVIKSLFFHFSPFRLVNNCNGDPLCLQACHQIELGHNIGEVHLHLKKIRSITWQIPVVFGKEQESAFIYLVSILWIDLALDKLLLDLIELIVCVLCYVLSKRVYKGVPVNHELHLRLATDLLVPKQFIILHRFNQCSSVLYINSRRTMISNEQTINKYVDGYFLPHFRN